MLRVYIIITLRFLERILKIQRIMFSSSHQYHSDMGRYLEAIKVVLVVTTINCFLKVPVSSGQEENELYKKEFSCIKRKIATCGISDDQKECKEYSQDFETISGDPEELTKEDTISVTKRLKKFASANATGMCTAALGLYCNSEKKRCARLCDRSYGGYDMNFNNFMYRDDVEIIVDDNELKPNLTCAELGSEYATCPIPETFPEQLPTDEDVKKLKCLYKQLVTCGITDNKKICKPFDSHDKEKLEEIAMKITGSSLDDIRKKNYPNDCFIQRGLKFLKDLSDGSRCSISDGLYCTNEKKCEKTANGCDEDYCRGVQKIASASDWKEDDCGVIECPDISKLDEHSSLEDMKKMKCLYKKLVTCGIADDQTECHPHGIGVKWLEEEIADKSPEDLKSTHETDKKAQARIKDMEGWLKSNSGGMCSMSEGLYCDTTKKRCSKTCKENGVVPCEHVAKIAAASDWEQDYDCGDSANCHGPVTTTDGSEKSGTGRLEVVNCRALAIPLLFIPVLVALY